MVFKLSFRYTATLKDTPGLALSGNTSALRLVHNESGTDRTAASFLYFCIMAQILEEKKKCALFFYCAPLVHYLQLAFSTFLGPASIKMNLGSFLKAT